MIIRFHIEDNRTDKYKKKKKKKIRFLVGLCYAFLHIKLTWWYGIRTIFWTCIY